MVFRGGGGGGLDLVEIEVLLLLLQEVLADVVVFESPKWAHGLLCNKSFVLLPVELVPPLTEALTEALTEVLEEFPTPLEALPSSPTVLTTANLEEPTSPVGPVTCICSNMGRINCPMGLAKN